MDAYPTTQAAPEAAGLALLCARERVDGALADVHRLILGPRGEPRR